MAQLLAGPWIISYHTVEGQEVDMLTFSWPEAMQVETRTLGETWPPEHPSPLGLAGAPRLGVRGA